MTTSISGLQEVLSGQYDLEIVYANSNVNKQPRLTHARRFLNFSICV